MTATATLTSDSAPVSRRYDTQIHRRATRTVPVGDVTIGSDHPVRVQSMINEDTLD
ncbi:MAG: 4-hydroxy-3-methylbut-2-en-1-yl diphosphate synthase, partial [Prochlorococcus sp.]